MRAPAAFVGGELVTVTGPMECDGSKVSVPESAAVSDDVDTVRMPLAAAGLVIPLSVTVTGRLAAIALPKSRKQRMVSACWSPLAQEPTSVVPSSTALPL